MTVKIRTADLVVVFSNIYKVRIIVQFSKNV